MTNHNESRDEPAKQQATHDSLDADNDDDDANESPVFAQVEPLNIPATNSISLQQHRKTVSVVEVEASGSRLITGSHDYTVAFWEFANMDTRLQPFRYIEPMGSYAIRALRFSPQDHQWILMASASSRPKLFDRNGSQVREYGSGDPYLLDMKNTTGHVSAINTAWWHPTSPDHFITAGQDSTVRIWNIGYRKEQDYVIVVKSKAPGSGGKSPVTHVRHSWDGRIFATGSADGSLKIWSANAPYNLPKFEQLKAHVYGSEISSLTFSTQRDYHLASRAVGSDESVKLWDLRSFKAPVAIAPNLPASLIETSLVYSPDEKILATGTMVRKGSGEKGKIVFLDSSTLDRVHDIELTESSVVSLCWNASLDQIVAGNGDGTVSMLYDPSISKKGALLPLAKNPPKRAGDQAIIDNPNNGSAGSGYVSGPIITPHALPLFQDRSGRSRQRTRIKNRKDPIISHRPDLPLEGGPGKGGRIGSSITQSMMRGIVPDRSREEDPRQALLKYAEIAEKEPLFITPAYKQTQPQTILDPQLLEKETIAEKRKLEEVESKLAGLKKRF